jgi:hypothetical protein
VVAEPNAATNPDPIDEQRGGAALGGHRTVDAAGAPVSGCARLAASATTAADTALIISRLCPFICFAPLSDFQLLIFSVPIGATCRDLRFVRRSFLSET